MISNDEIDRILALSREERAEAMLRVSPEDRQAIVDRAKAVSDEAIRKQFEEMKADGTLDWLKAKVAEDKAKRKRKR